MSSLLLRVIRNLLLASSLFLLPHSMFADSCPDLVAEYQSSKYDLETLTPKGPVGELSFVKEVGGSTTGARWNVDQSGRMWITKTDTIHPEMQTAADLITGTLYRFVGYITPESTIYRDASGRRVIAVKSFGQDLETTNLHTGFNSSYLRQLKYFAAFFKDWDRMRSGNNFDIGEGAFAMIDFGGTLGSRAQGAYKPGKLVSPTIGAFEGNLTFEEIMGDFKIDYLPRNHPWHQDLRTSDAVDLLHKFSRLDDKVIAITVRNAKFSDPTDTRLMINILRSRRDAMIDGLSRFVSRRAGSAQQVETTDPSIDLTLRQRDRDALERYVSKPSRINMLLRNGESLTPELRDFSHDLDAALAKLPPHRGMVFRGAMLPKSAIEPYENAAKGRLPLPDGGYLSATRSPIIAGLYAKMPPATQGQYLAGEVVIFEIQSLTGRDISTYSSIGEQEVLFLRNTRFVVKSVDRIATPSGEAYVHIQMNEVP